MSTAFKSIERGLKEAIAYANGETVETIHKIHKVDIPETDIRARTGFSQAEFAKSIGVEKVTLPNRERRRLTLATRIVAAYVGNNVVPAAELPDIIRNVHAAVAEAVAGSAEEPAEKPKPAVSIRKSVTPDYIVCLEDGKKFKTLKRHLRVAYDMTPKQYREKWGLKPDYPMTAPNYAAYRREVSKRIDFGRRRRAS